MGSSFQPRARDLGELSPETTSTASFGDAKSPPHPTDPPPAAGARLFLGVGQFPNPDIPEPYRVVVVLQFQRQLGRGLLIRLMVTIRQTEDGDVVLDQHAVVQHRESRGPDDYPCRVKSRTVENDVVGLPLPGRRQAFTRGVCWP